MVELSLRGVVARPSDHIHNCDHSRPHGFGASGGELMASRRGFIETMVGLGFLAVFLGYVAPVAVQEFFRSAPDIDQTLTISSDETHTIEEDDSEEYDAIDWYSDGILEFEQNGELRLQAT